MIKNLILVSYLTAIAFIDYDHQLIFDTMNYPLAGIGFIFSLFLDKPGFLSGVIGAGLGFSMLGLVLLISIFVYKQEGMGWGDIKLAAALGFFLGWKGIIACLMISFFIAAIVSVLLILFKIKDRKDYIPFGPFIVVSAILALFFNTEGLLTLFRFMD